MIKGAYTAMVTPFLNDTQIDLEGFIQNIHFQIEQGIDGLVILGTTGESPTLSFNEQKQLIQTAQNKIQGKIPLVVGTGSNSTQETIKKTQQAQDLGADAALVITPYYNKPTQEGMFQHFKAVAESVKIPLIIYNIFGRTGVNLQTETLKKLAEISNIVAVKESSGNMDQIMEVIETFRSFRSDFAILSGDDALTFPVMTLGGHGVISVISNLVPRKVKNLIFSLNQGDFLEARELHYHLLPLIHAAFIETNPIPIKAAMQEWGFAAGPCRLPLCEMQKINYQQLKKVLASYG